MLTSITAYVICIRPPYYITLPDKTRQMPYFKKWKRQANLIKRAKFCTWGPLNKWLLCWLLSKSLSTQVICSINPNTKLIFLYLHPAIGLSNMQKKNQNVIYIDIAIAIWVTNLLRVVIFVLLHKKNLKMMWFLFIFCPSGVCTKVCCITSGGHDLHARASL